MDQAIAFPILFEITVPTSGTATSSGRAHARIRTSAAYKRPSEADSAKWVVGDYFLHPLAGR